ncbi:MAG: PAS domain-containing protein [Gammaproteobacteria bacterium]|nr:PAS domain-containing protein [Gammaproteobacteria bacterium]
MKLRTYSKKNKATRDSSPVEVLTPNLESSYEDLIQDLPQVVFKIDLDGNWLFINQSWSQLSGFDVDQCIGTSYMDYIHPQDRSRCKATFTKIQHGDIEHCTEAFRFLISNGNYLWAEIHASTALSHDGQIIGIVGTINNISDRVSEEELLLANQRTLTALLNDLPGMVYRCRNNPDWTMEYVSGSSYQLTGYHPEDIVNSKRLSYGSMIHPDDSQEVWDEVQNAIRENRRFEKVYRIFDVNNKEKYVWERGKAIFSSNNEWLGLEGFIIDITRQSNSDRKRQKHTLYDEITGLPTPPLFLDRIRTVLKRLADTECTPLLILVHLDRLLKALDQLDSDSIDCVEREVAQRLESLLDPLDSITHLENQDWGLLFENQITRLSISELAQQIQDLFLIPITVGKSKMYVTTSIGIVVCDDPHQNAEELIRDASQATNRAQALGGGRYELFDSRINYQSISQHLTG